MERKYSVESSQESSQIDRSTSLQEIDSPFILEQYTVLNIEQNLKLLQHVNQSSLVFERLCTYYDYPLSLNYSIEEELLKRKTLNSKYNIILHDFSLNTTKRSFSIYYEAFAQGLNKEFVNHVKQNWRWRERELMNTMKCALKGLKELHDRDLVHGDLRMSNIVLTERGEVKLADQYCINFSKIDSTSYYKKDVQFMIATSSLLPPEAMEILKKQGENIDISNEQIYTQVITKSGDLWALGIILLEMVLLENIHNQVYDFTNYSLSLTLLQQKLKKAKQIFSKRSLIVSLLFTLLSEHEDKRSSAYEHIENSSSFIRKSVSFKESMKNSPANDIDLVKIKEEEEETQLELKTMTDSLPINILPFNLIQCNHCQTIESEENNIPQSDPLVQVDNLNNNNLQTESSTVDEQQFEQNPQRVQQQSENNLIPDEENQIIQIENKKVEEEEEEEKEKEKSNENDKQQIPTEQNMQYEIEYIGESQIQNQKIIDFENKNSINTNQDEIVEYQQEKDEKSLLQIFESDKQYSENDNFVIINNDYQLQDNLMNVSYVESTNSSDHNYLNRVQQTQSNNLSEKENMSILSNLPQISSQQSNNTNLFQKKGSNRLDHSKVFQEDFFDYDYSRRSSSSQMNNQFFSNFQKSNTSQRNTEYILFPENKLQKSKGTTSKNNSTQLNQNQKQIKLLGVGKTSSKCQEIPFQQKNTKKNNLDSPINEDFKGVFLLSNLEKSAINNSQIIQIDQSDIIKQCDSKRVIVTEQSQNSGITEYFNQISPIRESTSRLTTNQSTSMTEWMKESNIQNIQRQEQQNYKIDEKLQRLDELCDQALQKSMRNRQKIEMIAHSMKQSQEQGQCHNIQSTQRYHNNTNKDIYINNLFSKSNFNTNVSNQSLVEQLNQIQKQLNESSTSNSVHSSSTKGKTKNNSQKQIDNQLNFLSSNSAADQYNNKFALSQHDNLKLSAHYGSLALNHLVEYIEQSKNQENNHLLSSSAQKQQQEKQICQKMIETLFSSDSNKQTNNTFDFNRFTNQNHSSEGKKQYLNNNDYSSRNKQTNTTLQSRNDLNNQGINQLNNHCRQISKLSIQSDFVPLLQSSNSQTLSNSMYIQGFPIKELNKAQRNLHLQNVNLPNCYQQQYQQYSTYQTPTNNSCNQNHNIFYTPSSSNSKNNQHINSRYQI